MVDPCVPIDRARFRQLLALELDLDESASESAATISLTCEDGQIELTLDDALTRKRMLRRVDLRPVDPSAHTRLLALTVAEFVLASWLELRLGEPRKRKLEPVGPPPAPELEQRASRAVEAHAPAPPPLLQLGAAAEWLAFSSAFALIPCLSLRLNVPLSAALVLRAGAQLGRARLDGELVGAAGRQPVQVRTTIGSLLLALLYRARFGALELTGGIGVRGGVAYLEGLPPRRDVSVGADQSLGPWGGPLLSAGMGYHLGEHVILGLTLEAGAVALRTRAVGPDPAARTVLELRDMWGSAALGLDWEF
jgi:hypothetical protein